MKQLNSYRFYELGAKLHSLLGAESGARASDMFGALSEAQAMLDGLIKGDVLPLSTSKSDAVRLLDKIGAVFTRLFIDPVSKQLRNQDSEERLDVHELAMLRGLVEKFEHALAAELNRAPTYAVEKCGIYSTYELAENAREIFAEEIRAVIPDAAQKEFCSAGRALVFGLGTASVLHTLRSIELMVRVYFELFVPEDSGKGERSYASCLKKLAAFVEDAGRDVAPDKRVIQMLSQIKEHYRSPLLAPDVGYSSTEAMQLFNMAGTLISMMAEALGGETSVEDGVASLKKAG